MDIYYIVFPISLAYFALIMYVYFVSYAVMCKLILKLQLQCGAVIVFDTQNAPQVYKKKGWEPLP